MAQFAHVRTSFTTLSTENWQFCLAVGDAVNLHVAYIASSSLLDLCELKCRCLYTKHQSEFTSTYYVTPYPQPVIPTLAQLAELFIQAGQNAVCVWMLTGVAHIVTAVHRLTYFVILHAQTYK